MICIAELNGKKVKQFKAKNMESIYTQFNKYCNIKLKNAKYIMAEEVLGKMYWTDGINNIVLKRVNNIN
jgi:hypothetical protein